MPRVEAEFDLSHKQIVSYVLITDGKKILRYVRGGEGSAMGDYFYDSFSIGFGGHVKGDDRKIWSWKSSDFGYFNSVAREVNEEIGITISDVRNEAPIIGVINDDSTELGSKHFAFVHKMELKDTQITKTERAIRAPEWMDISDLHLDFKKYEHWSKLCIQSFFGQHQKHTCHIVPKGVGSLEFDITEQPEFLVVVGYIGSGKTLICSLLESNFGYHMIRGSSILKKLLGYASNTKVSRKKLQEEGLKFIKTAGGHDKLAKGIKDHMETNPSKRYVLDGLRYPETMEALRRIIKWPITVIYIESPIESLYNYYTIREDQHLPIEDFHKTLYHEVETNICKFYSGADITIFNHGELEDFKSTVVNYFMEKFR